MAYWLAVVFVIALAVGVYQFNKMNKGIKLDELFDDFDAPTISPHKRRPVLFGTWDITSYSIISWGNVEIIPIKKKVGGK